jgi:hypothetical protein
MRWVCAGEADWDLNAKKLAKTPLIFHLNFAHIRNTRL